MSDLREALEWYDSTPKHTVRGDTSSGGAAIETFVAAARRFLALTETGPDYEAAAKALYNAKPEVVSGSWPRWEDLRSAARALHLGNAKAVVDAAFADYLTEEE